MLSRLLRGRFLWTVLGLTAVTYWLRRRNEQGRGAVMERFMERNGGGWSTAWELVLRTGRAAVDRVRRRALR